MLKNIVVYYILNAGVFVGILLGMHYWRLQVFLIAFFVWALIYRPLIDYGRLLALGVLNEAEKGSFWSKTIFSTIGWKYFLPLYFGLKVPKPQQL